MKTKLIIWTLMALVLIATATAYEMCGYQKEINQNCTMLTPTLTGCLEYNYTIYNVTDSSVVEENSLITFSTDIYKFNITQPEGDYIVKLCDGTTREIKVTSKDKG